MRVLILGAGGHAKVVADILQLNGDEVVGFLDDNPATWNTNPLGIPVLGGIDQYRDFAADGWIMGIGSNRIRQQMVKRLHSDIRWCNACHPASTIARSARIGQGVVIGAHAAINPDASIGDHVIVNTGATVDHDCTIGDFAHVAPGVHLAGNVRVGTGTLIGVGATAVPGRDIGDWAVIGAGATVIRDVPAGTTAKGVPARW